MKRVFISQPVNGKSDEEINKTRMEIGKKLIDLLGDDLVVIDSWINDDAPAGTNPGVWYLGKSLEKLAKADYIYMADGWKDYRGCVIEHEVAMQYGISIIKNHDK